MKCRIYITLWAGLNLFFSSTSAGQGTTASEVYKQYVQGNFSQAKKGLDILLTQQPKNVDFLWKRAMCTLESNPTESIPFLEQCATIQPNYHPLLFWYLGKCYTAQQNYEKAIQAYEKYKPNNPIKAEKAIEQIQVLQAYLRNPLPVKITLLDTNLINTSQDEYAPFLFKDKFAFTRSIEGHEEILYLDQDTLHKLINNSNTTQKFQRSMPHFVQNTLYFYYNTDAATQGDIYLQTLENDTWTSAKKLSDSINSKFWETAPTTDSACHILIFASDRVGGYGGADLYFSVKDSMGKWKLAQNMGNILNTKGDETNPHLTKDGKTLYFISNGHQTLGGFDIFATHFKNGTWTKPQNIGYPINTPYNELNYYVIDSLRAYLSSDRPLQTHPRSNTNLYLVEYPIQKKQKRDYVDVFITAKNEQSQPIPFTLQIQDNLHLDTFNTTKHFTLPKNTRWLGIISSKGYLSQNITVLTTQEDTLWLYPILQPIQSKKNYVVHNIYFKLNSSDLETESYPALDQLVSMLQTNPQIRIQISGHTDNTGDTDKNLILSQNRANSVAKYLISKGVDDKRIFTKGYGSQKPIADNSTEEGRYKNRRVEFEIIE
ncbi:MAG: OmpA family protein [Bacteroidia bacterium]|nr:OmpA family protein [Bacteroidia bacterium]MDW8347530.1 OmpA family protein [Bacteroidia bacterium]